MENNIKNGISSQSHLNILYIPNMSTGIYSSHEIINNVTITYVPGMCFVTYPEHLHV